MAGRTFTSHMRFIPIGLVGLFLCLAKAWAGTRLPPIIWPAIQWPVGMQHFPIAHTMMLQGIPMHIHGFTSAKQTKELEVELQKQYDQKLMVIGQASGGVMLGKEVGEGYFLNFTIKPGHQSIGSQGEASLMSMIPPAGYVQQYQEDRRWWERHLPHGYRLLQHQVSIDRQQQAIYIVIDARDAASGVYRALKDALARQGLQPEAGSLNETLSAGPHHFVPNEASLQRYRSLDGQAKGATTVVHPVADGKTNAIVNLIFSRDPQP